MTSLIFLAVVTLIGIPIVSALWALSIRRARKSSYSEGRERGYAERYFEEIGYQPGEKRHPWTYEKLAE